MMEKSPRHPIVVMAFITLACCVVATGCSERQKSIGAIRDAFDNENYDETIVLCEHALRHDIRDGQVHYYYGLALLAKGRDFEGLRRFEDAVAADATLAAVISRQLLATGREAFDQGKVARASTRLRAALEYDPGTDPGRLKYLVAEAYFKDRDFAAAEELYASAVREWPDTSVAEVAYYNLAQSREALGDSTGALDALETQLERFPKGPLAEQARFKLLNLLYEHASSEFARGNYETVVEEILILINRTTNRTLVQRARFLLGEAYERLEEYEAAYEQYKAIIEKDRGASGRIVERAREKINAFRDSGLL